MLKKGAIIIGLALIYGLIMSLGVSADESKEGAPDLVALTDQPEGWTTLEPPQTASGNQLFTVINGGAELYVRLGFERAVFASYASADGKNINLEIYQMKNPGAAREVYAHKTGDGGRPAGLGTDSMLADYYLNFYRGAWQVTVSGYDADGRTVAALKTIAGLVDSRLSALSF
jgi:hypothetical protein